MDAEIQPYARPVITRPVVAIIRFIVIIAISRITMMPVAAPVVVIPAIARHPSPTLIVSGVDDIAILGRLNLHRP